MLEVGGRTVSLDHFSPDQPERIDLTYQIETPENVVLTYQLAGPLIRLCAWAFDFVVRVAMFMGGMTVLSTLMLDVLLPGASTGVQFLTMFTLVWAYYPVCEGFLRGQTLGKRLCGLRVIQEEGYPITITAAFLRNLVRAGDSLPFLYGSGLIVMLASGKFRRLGDLVARTIVISERAVYLPREPVIVEKISPLPHADINSYIPDPQTIALIDQFLGRRHVLPLERGHALARALARPLAKKLDYRGDPKLVLRYPMAFLARVYVTFHRERERDADEVMDAHEIMER